MSDVLTILNSEPEEDAEIKVQDTENVKEGADAEINEDEYTNIVTADGKRLKKIPGGYTLHGTGGDADESGLVSV